jgi:hypothetical protein
MGETSGGVAQDQSIAFEGASGSFALARLPPNLRAPRERLIVWFSLWVRWPSGIPQMRDGIGLAPISGPGATADGGSWWSSDNPASTSGKAITLSGGGDGTLRLYRKAINAAGPVTENLVLAWPRPITQWTEVWFVLLHGTASRPAQFRLYLDRQLVLTRAWGVTGTGTGMPEYEVGGAAPTGGGFYLRAVCLGATHPGVRMDIANLRVRIGEFDVDGTRLQDI